MFSSFRSIFVALVLLVPMSGVAADHPADSLRESSKAFASIAASVSPSVALVRVEGTVDAPAAAGYSTPFNDDFLRRFFGNGMPQAPRQNRPPRQQRVVGQGSAFVFAVDDGVLTDKSYLMTNNHVVEHADKITVTFPDGQEFDGKVTGRDPKSDVAVIEIETAEVAPLKLADSSALEVGEWVVAIGNPFGLSHTLTVGVVSAKGRTSVGINDYEDFIQTDAAINPGNSGGPLVNLDGEVVGINTAIFSRSGGYMGIGFAIPSNLANGIAGQLMEHGSVTRGQLGIVIQPLTAALAESFNIDQGDGILVSQVNADSPAERGGLEVGDIIVSYADKPVSDIGEFRNRVALTPPGEKRSLTIIRDGRQKKMSITVGELQEETTAAGNESAHATDLGVTVQALTPEIAAQLDVEPGKGVVVSNVVPGSVAALAGIRPRMVILEVDRKAVTNPREFGRAIDTADAAGRVLLLVSLDGIQRYLALSW